MRGLVAVVLLIAACAGAAPTRADAQERVACGAVDDLGTVVRAFLTGAVPAGDPATIDALTSSAAAADRAAEASSNVVLARAATDAASASAGLRSDGAPTRLVAAVRTLTEECEALGVDLRHDGVGAVAAQLVVQPGDLPEGWAVVDRGTAAHPDEAAAGRFTRCVGGDAEARPDTAEVVSATFVQDGGAQRVQSAVAHVGAEAARVAVRRFARPAASRCMTELLDATLPAEPMAGITMVGVTTEPLELGIAGAQGLRSDLTLRTQGHDLVVHLDNVLVARGEWFARLNLLGAREPLDRAFERAVVRRVLDRLPAR